MKNNLLEISIIIKEHSILRSELRSLAPIVVVMLPEAQASSVCATFERKAGHIYHEQISFRFKKFFYI